MPSFREHVDDLRAQLAAAAPWNAERAAYDAGTARNESWAEELRSRVPFRVPFGSMF